MGIYNLKHCVKHAEKTKFIKIIHNLKLKLFTAFDSYLYIQSDVRLISRKSKKYNRAMILFDSSTYCYSWLRR